MRYYNVSAFSAYIAVPFSLHQQFDVLLYPCWCLWPWTLRNPLASCSDSPPRTLCPISSTDASSRNGFAQLVGSARKEATIYWMWRTLTSVIQVLPCQALLGVCPLGLKFALGSSLFDLSSFVDQTKYGYQESMSFPANPRAVILEKRVVRGTNLLLFHHRIS